MDYSSLYKEPIIKSFMQLLMHLIMYNASDLGVYIQITN